MELLLIAVAWGVGWVVFLGVAWLALRWSDRRQ